MTLKNFKFKIVMLTLIIMTLIVMVLAVGQGAVKVSLPDILQVFYVKIFGINNHEITPLTMNIVWNLRLPRVLIGFFVGAGLSVSGVAMQSIVKNPMADPFVLGVASGAGFFATLGLIFGVFSFLGTYALPISAFLGAFISLLIVLAFTHVFKRVSLLEILLIGIVVSMIFDAATRYVILSAPNALGIHNTEFWMAGSLVNAKWDYFWIPISICTIIIVIIWFNYKNLALLSLGEDQARELGINVNRKRFEMIVLISLLTGIIISLSGVVGFIGMICPHLARKLVGGNLVKVIPTAIFVGGLFVIVSDILARVLIAPVELPLGLLTALFGGPIFLFIFIFKGNGRVRA
ncbi:iron ABC transporter permease [Tuanshanicoccus lijuaniae]|uniref:FecCD family ABC transporter permease n=1 Tax=Aerococcaceae bacterium zg-1292 TaxID=2774330 RepID=UPI0019366315|nr:iron ABC transporter permease [Aerococcaceae bacterium zg-1292]MBF6625123.1 iron ABC transporter permease [Aerococcaceae bacterium zg-BR9]MBF6978251.1 iron ABC transporter permease [Aerococcaceae bacterium zg-BR22]MBS4456466.1 iron ABC transporter permease [Aerococcaceae bacterium zg-A91]MBS4458316.1 iron ABC transporter permease [Aerococcaceae bacterium zg-BR33]